MTFNHLKMIPKVKIISLVSIGNTYFNWWVWGCGKTFQLGLPETHPTSSPWPTLMWQHEQQNRA